MKLKFLLFLILSASLVNLATGPARAGDEVSFRGLIPGVPVAAQELQQIYGKGALTLSGELIHIGGTVDLSQNSAQWTDVGNNGGITTTIPFAGDNNQVNVYVTLSVNIGTVTVSSMPGSSVNASAAVQFGGAIDFGLD
jgi:hypothetical protein